MTDLTLPKLAHAIAHICYVSASGDSGSHHLPACDAEVQRSDFERMGWQVWVVMTPHVAVDSI